MTLTTRCDPRLLHRAASFHHRAYPTVLTTHFPSQPTTFRPLTPAVRATALAGRDLLGNAGAARREEIDLPRGLTWKQMICAAGGGLMRQEETVCGCVELRDATTASAGCGLR